MHTQTQSACLMQCAIMSPNGDILGPETALQCVLLARQYFGQESAVCSCLPRKHQQEECFGSPSQLLFEYCLIPTPFVSPLAPPRTSHDNRDSHTEDPSKPDFFTEER